MRVTDSLTRPDHIWYSTLVQPVSDLAFVAPETLDPYAACAPWDSTPTLTATMSRCPADAG